MSGRLMLRKEGVRWAKLLHNIYVKGGGGGGGDEHYGCCAV